MTPLKHCVLASCLVLALGCGSSGIQVALYDPTLLGCSPPLVTDTALYQGSLDVAAPAEFYVGAILANRADSTPARSGTLNGGLTLEGGGDLSGLVIDQVVVTYESKPKLSGFKDHTISIRAPFTTGANGAGQLALGAFNIIGADAAQALDALTPSSDPADVVTLYATIRFQGSYPGGRRMSTDPAILPIQVRRSVTYCESYRRASSCVAPGQTGDTTQYCCTCGTFGSPSCNFMAGCF
jgi:hypothetical protein